MFPNKLHITKPIELTRAEEKISKQKAVRMYDEGVLDTLEAGTFISLRTIHGHLFKDIYEFAGELRTENISKGGFRFVPVLYLQQALEHIDQMPHTCFITIVEKYVEMNIAHPFRDGNGRSSRIWLDVMLKKELCKVIDWNRIGKEDYLLAMQRSPVQDTELKTLLQASLTDKINDRDIYLKGIDASYMYEGYDVFKAENLLPHDL